MSPLAALNIQALCHAAPCTLIGPWHHHTRPFPRRGSSVAAATMLSRKTMSFSSALLLVLSALLSSEGQHHLSAATGGASIPSSLEATSFHNHHPARLQAHHQPARVHQHYQQCLHEVGSGSNKTDAKARQVSNGCRYGVRTSQRLVALLHRTWAPQSNPLLAEIPHSKATKPPPDLSMLVPRVKVPSSCKASSGTVMAETDDIPQRREPLDPRISGPGRVAVFTALSGGPVCSGEAREDWRDELPRRLGELLGVRVVVYSHRSNTCHYCYLSGSGSNRSNAAADDPSGCVRDIKGAGVGALVVLGSGEIFPRGAACFPTAPGEKHRQDGFCQQQFFDLWQLLSKAWARSAQHLIHITDVDLGGPTPPRDAFKFDVVIDESEFVKPVRLCTRDIMTECHKSFPGDRIVYPGDLSQPNGQLRLLQLADARILSDHVVDFYGVEGGGETRAAIEALAKEAGLTIRFHGRVSKAEYFGALCAAKGMVWLGEKRNPSALYDALAAGIPIMIPRATATAHRRVPGTFLGGGEDRQEGNKEPGGRRVVVGAAELHSPSFIKLANFSSGYIAGGGGNGSDDELQAVTGFNRDLFDFFQDTLQSDWMAETRRWMGEQMQEDEVYHDLCQRMCLCKGGPCNFKGDGDEKGPPREISPRPRVKFAPGRVPRTNPEVEALIRSLLLLHEDAVTREGDAAKPPIAAAVE